MATCGIGSQSQDLQSVPAQPVIIMDTAGWWGIYHDLSIRIAKNVFHAQEKGPSLLQEVKKTPLPNVPIFTPIMTVIVFTKCH